MTVPAEILEAAGADEGDVVDLLAQLDEAPAADLAFIRHGTNVIFGSRERRLVWRLSVGVPARAVRRNVELAAALAARAPVVGPATERVAERGRLCLTQWPMADPRPPGADPADLGTCLRAVHAVPPADDLPVFGDFAKIPARLRAVERSGAPRGVVDALASRASAVVPAMQEVVVAEHGLLHGDAHVGNLMEVDGSAVLVDLDDLCTGPHQLDLVPAYVASLRLGGGRAAWDRVARAYGEDLEGWEHLGVAVRYRELTMTSWLAALWGSSPGVEREVLHRLATWDLPPGEHEPWSAF